MSVADAAGIGLIALPVAFNAAFATLGARFEYPDILRRPTGEVLEKFTQGGTSLVLTWWAFALTAVLLAPLAVLLAAATPDADPTVRTLSIIVGTLAAVVQFLGLIRWPFLVPYLAKQHADPQASEARKEAVDIVFQSFNRYLGVAVGEHLGYLLTGAWSILAGIALTQTDVLSGWIGVPGVAIGGTLMLCSLEFVGRAEREGWKLAAGITPVAYVAWSLWLIAAGIGLLT